MVCTDENLSANDLAAVRLTCKELYAVATKEICSTIFHRSLCHDVGKESGGIGRNLQAPCFRTACFQDSDAQYTNPYMLVAESDQ